MYTALLYIAPNKGVSSAEQLVIIYHESCVRVISVLLKQFRSSHYLTCRYLCRGVKLIINIIIKAANQHLIRNVKFGFNSNNNSFEGLIIRNAKFGFNSNKNSFEDLIIRNVKL